MKNIIKISGIIFFIITVILINSCEEKPTPPVVTTTAISAISYTTATSGGDATDEGGAPIVSKGVCWNTSAEPTVENNKTFESGGLGAFTSNITQLTSNTLYYVRAYATNAAGTGYGNQVSFTTKQVEVPVLTTTDVSSITQTTAISGGNITDDKGGSVTARGVCLGTATNPTTADSKTTDGTGTGSYVSNLTGLQPGTIYYVKSYATNSAGTAYGNEFSFKTLATVSTLTTTEVSSITSATATSGGIITSDGGASVSARGVCWSTLQNPTTADNKTLDGSGTGSYVSNLTGLQSGTVYYVRAYATNSAGTAYGNELSFTTLGQAPSATTHDPTSVTATSSTLNGIVNANFLETIVTFEYGTTINYGSTIAANQSPVTSNANTSVSVYVSDLSPYTTYHFRIKAVNSLGTTYGNDLTFTTPHLTIKDVDGNTYNIVSIGTQIWMAENLKTTKYNDGATIPLVTDGITWVGLSTPAYCWQQFDIANNATYGALYNWYAINAEHNGNKNVCPTGWHVPSDTEWTTLTDFLGGYAIAGGKLKEKGWTHWLPTNTGATDETGFTALPGGYMYDGLWFLTGIKWSGNWWSSTEYTGNYVWCRRMFYDNSVVSRDYFEKIIGLSIRCLQDN